MINKSNASQIDPFGSIKAKYHHGSSCLWHRTIIKTMAIILLISTSTWMVDCSHKSIHLDNLGNYHGIVIGFTDNFQSFEQQYINTTIVSIMNQIQKTSNILKILLGVQIADVTIILPDKWQIDLNDFQQTQFIVDHSNQYRSLSDADILFTNDDKSQILTMQYGDCGEGALAINFPMLYVSDDDSGRLLAHQWIIYRYGVFNEFGLEDDFHYPVYYTSADGGIRANVKPEVNSCFQGANAHFKYSNNCNNVTDPNTGRPINPNCDVIPTKNSIQSSFMYAPTAVSELHLCDSTTHDYQSPTKHNIICDYQSIQDVIAKHFDFERFRPNFNQNTNISAMPIRFQILQGKSNLDEQSSPKANVLYVLPKHNSKFLETSMDTIKKIDYFSHQAMFALYGQQFNVFNGSGWQKSSLLSMIFPDNEMAPERVNLSQIFNEISQQFKNVAGGTCVFFFSGDLKIDNTNIDYVEHLADLLNKKNIRLKVIIYDEAPVNDVLRFFDELISKLNSKSSVEYAFGRIDGSSSTMAFRTQLPSIINTLLFDLLQDLTDQTHLLIKRETVRSSDPTGVEFSIDPTIGPCQIIIEMNTNGKGSDLAFGFNLTDSADGFRNVIRFLTFESYEKSIIIRYKIHKSGIYRFNFQSNVPHIFITTSVRLLSKRSLFNSYKDGIVSAKCWIESNAQYPLRGFVQVSQGLNGPVYDADVTFIARSFSKAQQKNEITFPLHDNGRGNPDITAHDGIYSSYLDSIFNDYSESYSAAYTISARIISNKVSVKPGNFGNTVMFVSKPRCCGSELKTNGDSILNHRFERIVHCGSFYYSMQNERQPTGSYAIRDLRIIDLDPDNRTINLEWSSPFYSMDQNKPIIIKAFHSYSQHSKLPREIKESFDDDKNEADLEIITNDNNEQLSVLYIPPYAEPKVFEPSSKTQTITNSLRQVTIKILSPEEGYYFIAVKERNDDVESKPSNIVNVYLKSNVLIENTTALAIDNSRLSGQYLEHQRSRPLPWILLICISCALLLFIITLIIICLTIRRFRLTNKNVEANFDGPDGPKKTPNGTSIEEHKKDSKSTYFMANQDANSLISNDKIIPNSTSASNHTSCSSVNTVDNGQHPYLNHTIDTNRMNDMSGGQSQNSSQTSGTIMKELNVATLLPNSWDAKDLLDHWGRVQEAKLRQESPPVIRVQQSNSPSVLSYGGSSLDYNNHSYLCQPAIVQTPSTQQQPEYQTQQQQQSIYSPYSNASSIWQHQKQLQQQQQQQQLHGHIQTGPYGHHGQHFIMDGHHYHPHQHTNSNYDDNGLPEYSVVRKILPNISQV